MTPRGWITRGETRILDAEARLAAPGEFVELPDGVVHYELGGAPSGPVVVLVPGLSVPYPIWDPTFQALVEAGFRVLRYDLYGRGFSDRPDMRYDQDLFDRQLISLLAALEIDGPVDLIGLSLGGAIAVVFADRHPERVRGLCLIDPAGLPWRQSLPAALVKAPLLGELLLGLLGGGALVSKLADVLFRDEDYTKLKEAFLEQMGYLGFKRALLSTLRCGVVTGAEGAYAGVGAGDLPVMLIWGVEDRMVPFALHKTVMALIPRLAFHAVLGAGHIPHFERPGVVNPLIVEFFTRLSYDTSSSTSVEHSSPVTAST